LEIFHAFVFQHDETVMIALTGDSHTTVNRQSWKFVAAGCTKSHAKVGHLFGVSQWVEGGQSVTAVMLTLRQDCLQSQRSDPKFR
jgi:hypothetical protein